MKISAIQQKRYLTKLKVLKEKEPELTEAYKLAQSLGDFSENSELDAAREELNSNRMQQATIQNILSSAEVVPYDTTNLITVGSMLEVVSPKLNNGEKTMLLLSDSGECLLEGVLNSNTPLGKAVLGGVSGEYEVNNNIFKVTKITSPDVEAFARQYPSDNEVLEGFFGRYEADGSPLHKDGVPQEEYIGSLVKGKNIVDESYFGGTNPFENRSKVEVVQKVAEEVFTEVITNNDTHETPSEFVEVEPIVEPIIEPIAEPIVEPIVEPVVKVEEFEDDFGDDDFGDDDFDDEDLV